MKCLGAMTNIKAKRENITDDMALLHVHNPRPDLLQSKFDSISIHRVPHPPYSPDITPSDFWLFACANIKLEGMFFDILATRLAEVEEILGDMSITE
jgi:hypothetical protein